MSEVAALEGPALSQSLWLRLGGFASLYFAQGVPIGLLTIALPAWMAAQGASTGEVAAFISITGLPWGLKLIAGPFMDKFSFLPMGRRRPWVMAAQAGLALSLLSFLTVSDPIAQLALVTVLGFVTNSFAAVQDVAVDGMAIDVLPETERGRANAFMAAGQVAGFSAFGALDGWLLQTYGVPVAAVASAAAVTLIFVLITVVRERPGERMLPWSGGQPSPEARARHREATIWQLFGDLIRGLILPMSLLLMMMELLARSAAGISLSVLPVLSAQGLGYSAAEYSSFVGLASGVSAAVGLLFGPIIDRYGAGKLVAVGLLGGGVSYVLFAFAEPYWGSDALALSGLASVQLFSQAFFTAMIAMFMGICWSRVAATQFAVYMSLANLSRTIGAGLFAVFASNLDLAGSLHVIGVLMLAAAVIMLWFDPVRHARDLAALEASGPRSNGLDPTVPFDPTGER